MHLPRLSLLIVAIALACAGLGAWLGNTIADDAGSIVAVALICGVLGSFAPGTIRWASAEVRKHDRRPR